jgi:hypothetical protein
MGRRAILDDLRNRTSDDQSIARLDAALTGSVVRGTAELRNDTLPAMGIERLLVSTTWLVTQADVVTTRQKRLFVGGRRATNVPEQSRVVHVRRGTIVQAEPTRKNGLTRQPRIAVSGALPMPRSGA